MPRNFYVRPHIPHLDLIEATKSVVIWTAGIIELSILFALIFGGIWLYAASKAVA